MCTVLAGSPVARISSSISTGLGPSAATMRSRSLLAISGKGLGGSAFLRRRELAWRWDCASEDRREHLDDVMGASDEAGALLQEICWCRQREGRAGFREPRRLRVPARRQDAP
jgi:hypothetical protein